MGKLNEQQIKKRNRIVELLTAVRHTTNDIEKVADEILSLIESNQERGQVSQSQIAPPKSNYYDDLRGKMKAQPLRDRIAELEQKENQVCVFCHGPVEYEQSGYCKDVDCIGHQRGGTTTKT